MDGKPHISNIYAPAVGATVRIKEFVPIPNPIIAPTITKPSSP